MSLRVVGAGLGRTGTHSLKLALETLLDAPCYHMIEIRERPDDADVWRRAAEGETLDLTRSIEGYAATVDWPTAAFWRQLSQENPDAVILLSTRASSEEWWESANSTIFEVSRQMDPGPVYHMLNSSSPAHSPPTSQTTTPRSPPTTPTMPRYAATRPQTAWSSGGPETAGSRSATRSAYPRPTSRSRTATPATASGSAADGTARMVRRPNQMAGLLGQTVRSRKARSPSSIQ